MNRYTYAVPAHVIVEVDAATADDAVGKLHAETSKMFGEGGPVYPHTVRVDGILVSGAYLLDSADEDDLVDVEPLHTMADITGDFLGT